jgi:UDP-N-acetylmuramoylalanine--D-glutamate ligase
MRAYFEAKWRLLDRTVGGVVLVGSSVQKYAIEIGRALPAEACVGTEEQPADVLLAGTVFEHYPQRENFLLAAAWWRFAGLAETELYAAAHTFTPGRHRLARIAVYDGVTFWNDSKATNFHAVEAAVGGFVAPVVLIAGGRAKGGDIGGFVRRIASRVKHAFLIGETRHTLAEACAAYHVSFTACSSLEEAVQKAKANTRDGDHVLLSPGFASFDMFTSYEDRGNQFEHLVNNLRITSKSH